jgi:phosphoribosylformimino-5-aminoimidazole carboxamide ribotide isomerase
MVIPAIDIMDGEVVRLLKGNEEAKTSYRSLGNPVDVAKKWVKQGAKYLHIIDLDAALGLGDNRNTIKTIIKAIKVPTQVGGGIRSYEYANSMFDIGVDRIILGSLAMSNTPVLNTLLSEYGARRIVVALDHSNNLIRTEGWKHGTEIKLLSALKKFKDLGVETFLVTNIERDGTLEGPDIGNLRNLSQEKFKIIVAGGISSVNDVIRVKELGVEAVIVGKALYEGRFNLLEVLKEVK